MALIITTKELRITTLIVRGVTKSHAALQQNLNEESLQLLSVKPCNININWDNSVTDHNIKYV